MDDSIVRGEEGFFDTISEYKTQLDLCQHAVKVEYQNVRFFHMSGRRLLQQNHSAPIHPFEYLKSLNTIRFLNIYCFDWGVESISPKTDL